MRYVSLATVATAVVLSLCSCASGMHKDSADARSYQRQRAIASSLSDRREDDARMRQQMEQERRIERAGGSPIPH
jgi:hypothetical protein